MEAGVALAGTELALQCGRSGAGQDTDMQHQERELEHWVAVDSRRAEDCSPAAAGLPGSEVAVENTAWLRRRNDLSWSKGGHMVKECMLASEERSMATG